MRPPACNAITLVNFHQLVGQEGAVGLLAQTTNVAVELLLTKPQERTCSNVDGTLPHKTISELTRQMAHKRCRTLPSSVRV